MTRNCDYAFLGPGMAWSSFGLGGADGRLLVAEVLDGRLVML